MADSGLQRRLSSELGRQPPRDRDSKRVSKLFSKERAKSGEQNLKSLLSKVLAKVVPQSVTNKSQPKVALKPLRLSMNKKVRRQANCERASQENSATNRRKLSKLFAKDQLLKTLNPRLTQSIKRQNSWCFSPMHNTSACHR